MDSDARPKRSSLGAAASPKSSSTRPPGREGSLEGSSSSRVFPSKSSSNSSLRASGLPATNTTSSNSTDSPPSTRRSSLIFQQRMPTHSQPTSPAASRLRNISSSSAASSPSRSPVSPSSSRTRTTSSTQRNGVAPASSRRLASISQGHATTSSSSLASSTSTSSSLRGKQQAVRPQRNIGEDYRLGKVGVLPLTQDAVDVDDDGRAIVWLDIDNTLYRKSTRIAELMTERIRAYFLSLGLSTEEAEQLHSRYYKEYGLAIRGLVMHHQIDALDYDAKCDAALPLERILRPDRRIKALLRDLDRTKCRVWALTNAYKTHAIRVLDLLGLKQYIEGVVFCDYAMERFACKPEAEFYHSAMKAVGMHDPSRCYFVDDSALNIRAARALHWRSCVLFQEQDAENIEDDEAEDGIIPSNSVLAHGTLQSSGQPAFKDINELQAQVWALPRPLKEQMLRLTLQACMPDNQAYTERILREIRSLSRSRFDDVPARVVVRTLGFMTIPDLLRCRQISRQWKTRTGEVSLWKAHLDNLSREDAYPPRIQRDVDYEPAAKALYRREQNWANGHCQSLVRMQGHTGLVTAIKLRGRSTLVTGSYDETIRVWNLATGACTKILRAKAISCLDFSIEDGVLAAGLYDTGRVMLWDMKTWTLLQTLSGHNKGIRQVTIKGDYLVSVGQDKAIVVWDWRNGTKVVRFGQQSNVSLGVSIVGQDKLVAVTVDGIIRTFDLAASTRDMIGQFDIRKLSSALATRLAGLKDGAKMLQWFAAHGDTMTIGSSDTIIHLRWKTRYASEANGHSLGGQSATGMADLRSPPLVVNVVHTVDTSIGCVDAAKQRIVCARRASSQRSASSANGASANRRLFTTTLDGEHATRADSSGSEEKKNGITKSTGIVPISGGAWQAHAAELSLSAHNPTALACDQDRCVVGTTSGFVYSLGFAIDDKATTQTSATPTTPSRSRRTSASTESATPPPRKARASSTTPQTTPSRAPLTPTRTPARIAKSSAASVMKAEGPETPSVPSSDMLNVEIADLTALRSVWSHLFVQ